MMEIERLLVEQYMLIINTRINKVKNNENMFTILSLNVTLYIY